MITIANYFNNNSLLFIKSSTQQSHVLVTQHCIMPLIWKVAKILAAFVSKAVNLQGLQQEGFCE